MCMNRWQIRGQKPKFASQVTDHKLSIENVSLQLGCQKNYSGDLNNEHLNNGNI